MKTSDKIWISVGFLLLSVILGYTIYAAIYLQKATTYLQKATNYNVTYLQKTTPKIYHVKSQINPKNDILISCNWSYSAILRDDSREDKEFYIKLLYTEAIHEVLCDFCLEDYRQQKNEIIYDIKEAITAKVVQQFPDIEFQIIHFAMVFNI